MRELTVLRRIVGLWDSLDAVGPDASVTLLKDRMEALIDEARGMLEVEANAHSVIAALEPFARMYRVGSDPKEHALHRGVASDMTVITSGDFRRAFDLMPAKWRQEHLEAFE